VDEGHETTKQAKGLQRERKPTEKHAYTWKTTIESTPYFLVGDLAIANSDDDVVEIERSLVRKLNLYPEDGRLILCTSHRLVFYVYQFIIE
jgi:hypothetical protein